MDLLQRLKETGQVPNALSWTRLLLFWVPATLIIIDPHDPTLRWWSVVAFVLIVATDKLDGTLARSWDQVTKMGKIIDPLADKALVVALVVALCATNILASPWGWWFLGLNVVREAAVSFLRYQRKKGTPEIIIPANKDGKYKMVLQSVGLTLALMPIGLPGWWFVFWVPLAVSLYYSATSGFAYLRAK